MKQKNKMSTICNIFKIMRPHHWSKNFVMLLPLFFDGRINNKELVIKVIFGIIIFSFLASSVYILNDIIDLNYDKSCPYRCNRPLPSGHLQISIAKIIFIFNTLVSIFICVITTEHMNRVKCLFIIIIYLSSNFFYSLKGKNIIVIDIILIELGYLLRLNFSYFLTGIQMEKHLYISVLTGLLALILSKRYYELKLPNYMQRKSLHFKNSSFILEKCINFLLVLTILMYSFWCLELRFKYGCKIMITVLLLIFLCLKYRFNIKNEFNGDLVLHLIQDKLIVALAITFIVFLFQIMY